MRLSARTVSASVGVVIDSTARPVRMTLGGVTYRMALQEAIDLATLLADAVSEAKTQPAEQETTT